jgi:hypothetical protein
MIKAYLTDNVTIVRESHDELGRITGTALIPIPARIDYRVRRIVNFKGEEISSDKMVMFPRRELYESDKIRIAGVDYAIAKIVAPKDFSWDFFEVYL